MIKFTIIFTGVIIVIIVVISMFQFLLLLWEYYRDGKDNDDGWE